jgi:RNA polymerase II elongation factor ELL
MHLLAIRPYKKPELLARLQRDGVREKDRNSLSQVLGQVAVFGRDNSYTLAKHLLSEIRMDWPGYSDNEKKIVKKRQSQESHSAGSSPAATSPAHSLSSQGSPTSSQKRPTSTTDDDAVPVYKKARIAHVKKDGDSAKREPSPKESSKPVKQEATTTTLSPDSSNDNSIETQKSKEKHQNNHETDTQKFDATSTSETPDYLLDFTAITSADQRGRYKQSFNSEYEEYRMLHANIDKVTRRFKELEMSLRKEKEGTDNYENIKNKIVSEYKSMKKDPKYIEQRSRCSYLHKKLGHLKKLIHEYDQSQMVDS